MNNLIGNIGHIVTSLVIICAVTVLAWHGTITGSEALTIIGVLGGVSVGGSVASSSAGAPAPGLGGAPALLGTATLAATTTPDTTTTTSSSTPAPTDSGGSL